MVHGHVASGDARSIHYLDNILLAGATIDENLKNLELPSRTAASVSSVIQVLGHTISEQGIQLTAEKVKVIKDTPPPKNLAELHAFP